MFYTLIENEPPSGTWTSERFICFEADNPGEAIQRAEWFGFDLNENYENGYPRWGWHSPGMGTSHPRLTNHRLEETFYAGGWVILYKDDNMKSSFAIPLNSSRIPP